MHAYLVTGGDPEERAEWAENFFKTQEVVEILRIGRPMKNHLLKTVRELIHTLVFSPIDPKRGRGIIMEDAHLLTTEAANAFLKTLEEPLGATTLILTAPNRESVFATIASRALHIDLGTARFKINDEEKEQATAIFTKLINAGVGERLEFGERIGKREEALDFCVHQIFVVREMLRSNIKDQKSKSKNGDITTDQLLRLLTRLEQARQDLEANVNAKLTLTELLLDYK